MISRFATQLRLFFLLLLAPLAAAQGTQIGFEEEFALAEDRTVALEELIPGTADYYYYHCLHRQNVGAFGEVESLLKTWIQRHGRGGRVEEVENRQALLRYAEDPAKAFGFLIGRLGLRFDHQRQVPGEKPDLPTALDPESITLGAFADRALRQHRRTLDGFRDSAFPFLSTGKLDESLLMSLLKRLDRPDLPGLPALVVRNLESEKSRGFGSLGIHRKLFLEQLEECARLRPTLLRESSFIETYVLRLRPNDDVQWRRDASLREAYLDRLWSFAQRLAPAQNSFKAHVLYHRLTHDLGLGRPDQGRFLEYLRLPRSAGYVNRTFLKREERGDGMVNLGLGFSTDLPAIGNDEPLVRAYLSHFFVDEGSFEAYAPFVREEYLSRVFAETKILAGVGDMEQWYSMLDDPTYYEALKERVEIEFPPTMRTDYGARDAVALEVDLKNVETLLVKVFEINTLNYYSAEGKEVDASINVDGLVAGRENSYEYQENPLRRVRRSFEFPSLQEPGVYVVEFIGNGLSSRAVVRKGRLQYLERLGAAGHVLRVLDEKGRHLVDASVRFGGREYEADRRGEIVIPFSTDPGSRPIILRHAGRCTLEHLDHGSEDYRFDTGIFLDRESLLAGRDAKIIVRPKLRLSGEVVSLALLEEPILTITSRDRDGVASSSEIRDLEFTAGGEFVHEIRVPEGLASLSVNLKAHVRNLSRGEDVDLDGGTEAFVVNGIDQTVQTDSPLLGRTSGGYFLDVLGKNGEAVADRAVELRLWHRHFTESLNVTLKTDAQGRISLGKLEGISTVQASGLPGGFGGWQLRSAARTYPELIQGVAGETLRVPYQGDWTRLSRKVASLIELRGGVFKSDAYQRLALANGFLELRDLAPGNYDLFLKEAGESIDVIVGAGEVRDGWVIGRDRMLEAGGSALLHVTGIEVVEDRLEIHLANAGEETRVHLFSTRYLPAFDPFGKLWSPDGLVPNRVEVVHPDSSYHSGREIGEEYRYILDRRQARKYPGNMLKRPGLLLNPWALEETDSVIGLGGGAGGKFGGRFGGKKRSRAAGGTASRSTGSLPGTFPDLDFLPLPSALLANLRAGDDGVVRIPLAELGDGQQVHAVAVDRVSTVYTSLALPEKQLTPLDRRLSVALDSELHLTEEKRIEFVAGGASAVIEDVATSDVETYDSLASIYRFFSTFTGNADLVGFEFILHWPELEAKEKRELYSEHACHELNFFLYRKDPAFFAEVIRPYLSSKLHKTFLDRWLLDEDLTAYLDPWAFDRLNVVEQILLARRLEGEGARLARHVRERVELIPSDPVQLGFRFDSALKSETLSMDEGGVRGKLGELRKSLKRKASSGPAAPGAPAPSGRARSKAELAPAEELELEDALEEPVLADAEMDKKPARRLAEKKSKDREGLDLGRREDTRRLYRAPSRTRAFVEHNYWHRRIGEQVGGLIPVNGFWLDYAESGGQSPFFSTRFHEATGNFAEMMLALSVIDLPFEAGEHELAAEGSRLTVNAATPLLLVRKEIAEATSAADGSPLLLSQNFFRLDDRYRHEGNERRDNFVTDEFLKGIAYGCQVVLTNPTSTPRKLELLLQIPEGAIPVGNGFRTRGVPLQVNAYGTATFEYSFYFPRIGAFPHYPVHAGTDGELIAFAAPVSMNVVAVPSRVDTTSWEHVSQSGSGEEVLAYLTSHNLLRTDLSRIAWRMRDAAFFQSVIELLRGCYTYEHVLWSYGLRHADPRTAREYLRHANGFLNRCGRYLDTPLVTIDPVERHAYQHIEYAPLFNGRAHSFGKRREILNRDFAAQYLSLLAILAYRPQLDDTDRMSVTYYLLLQDRIGEALASFARIDPRGLPTSLQYDYMQAYLDFFTDEHALARGIAERYLDHPVKRWRALFQDVVNQLDEAEGEDVATSDPEDRTQQQTELAASEPSLDLSVEARNVNVEYRHLESCEVSYYRMDIEFLFSTSPFVQQGSGSFAYVEPNRRDVVALPPGGTDLTFALPSEFQSANVLVEVNAGGLTRRQAYYANSLSVQMIETYGQLKVTHDESGKPLAKVYVKVFARLQDGSVRFHKDGYTDLRGRYDYASLSGDGSGGVERYAILVLSEVDGAVIREVDPPVE
jgi:hypothetical protein